MKQNDIYAIHDKQDDVAVPYSQHRQWICFEWLWMLLLKHEVDNNWIQKKIYVLFSDNHIWNVLNISKITTSFDFYIISLFGILIIICIHIYR